MSVNPGFGGQSFIEESLGRIAHVKKMIEDTGKKIEIAVDGGVNAQTAPNIIRAGANILISGSYLFSSLPMESTLKTLRQTGAVLNA